MNSAVHGWIHEFGPGLTRRRTERAFSGKGPSNTSRSIPRKRPPSESAHRLGFSTHTFDLIRKAGFLYDSSSSPPTSLRIVRAASRRVSSSSIQRSQATIRVLRTNRQRSAPLPDAVY